MAKLKNNLKALLKDKYGNDVPSQERLAVDIGVTQNTLSRWLNQKIDRFDSDVVAKLCIFLDCEVGELLYLDREKA